MSGVRQIFWSNHRIILASVFAQLCLGIIPVAQTALAAKVEDGNDIVAASGMYGRIQSLASIIIVMYLAMLQSFIAGFHQNILQARDKKNSTEVQTYQQKIGELFQYGIRSGLIIGFSIMILFAIISIPNVDKAFYQSVLGLNKAVRKFSQNYVLLFFWSLPASVLFEALNNVLLVSRKYKIYALAHLFLGTTAIIFSALALFVLKLQAYGLGASFTAATYVATASLAFYLKKYQPDFLRENHLFTPIIHPKLSAQEKNNFRNEGLKLAIAIGALIVFLTIFTARIGSALDNDNLQAFVVGERYSGLAILLIIAFDRFPRITIRELSIAEPQKVNKAFWISHALSFVIAAVNMLILGIGSSTTNTFANAFINTKEDLDLKNLQRLSNQCILFYAASTLFISIHQTSGTALSTIGKSKWLLIRPLTFAIICACTFSSALNRNIQGFMGTLLVGDIANALFLTGAWFYSWRPKSTVYPTQSPPAEEGIPMAVNISPVSTGAGTDASAAGVGLATTPSLSP